MNLLVCISHVPDTTAKINFDAAGKALDATGVQFVINPYDEFSLTKAYTSRKPTAAPSPFLTSVDLKQNQPLEKHLPSVLIKPYVLTPPLRTLSQ